LKSPKINKTPIFALKVIQGANKKLM